MMSSSLIITLTQAETPTSYPKNPISSTGEPKKKGLTIQEQIALNKKKASQKTFPLIDFDANKRKSMTPFKWNVYKSQAINQLDKISKGPDIMVPNASGAAKSAINENKGLNEAAVHRYNEMAETYNSNPEHFYNAIRQAQKEGQDSNSHLTVTDISDKPFPVIDFDIAKFDKMSPKDQETYLNAAAAHLHQLSQGPDDGKINPRGAALYALEVMQGNVEAAIHGYNIIAEDYNKNVRKERKLETFDARSMMKAERESPEPQGVAEPEIPEQKIEQWEEKGPIAASQPHKAVQEKESHPKMGRAFERLERAKPEIAR
jgi:hypothetical protein